MIISKLRNWMILLLVIHLVVPSVHYFPFYPNLVLSWFGFDWYPDKGWVVFLQYAFVGLPAFIFIGLATLLPLLLLLFVLFQPGPRSRDRAVAWLMASLLLLAIYVDGWLLYTWPLPYQPVQTFSIAVFALLAYKAWHNAVD
jgi:hypothetical protein